MQIIFSEERMPKESIIESMTEAGGLCIAKEGLDSDRVVVSVTFAGNEEIRELNSVYRKKDAVTDVLSFPQYENLSQIPDKGPILLGDVVICTEQALIQADEFGHSPARELVYLFVHSIHHLLGYDHREEEEKEAMRKEEERIMEQVGLPR